MDRNRVEWWEDYFRRDWLLMEGFKESAADFIIPALGLPPGSRILDLGCGYGRNTIALARNGYSAVGLDNCGELLSIARSEAQEAGVHVHLVRADMRQMPFEEASYSG